MSTSSASRKKHTAPGPAAGYFFQPEVALKMLAEADADASIAIEADDDITERVGKSITKRAQLKHQLDPHGAFTDSSVDLWKTLSIWTKAAAASEFDTKLCSLLLVTNGTVSDCFIRKALEAKVKARNALIDEMLDKAFSETVEPFATVVRNHDRKLVYSVFDCIKLADANANNKASVKSKALAILQLSHSADQDYIYQGLLGWIHDTTIVMWRNKQQAWITKKSFATQYQALVKRYFQYKRIGLHAHLINVSATDRDSAIHKLFVKQLRAVKADEDVLRSAIIDFTRCNTERARLATEGELTRDDWTHYDESLQRHWQIKRRISLRSPQATPEETGHALYDELLLHEAKIAGDTVQDYLTSGTFHRLANDRTIGWHPEFTTLFPAAGDGNSV